MSSGGALRSARPRWRFAAAVFVVAATMVPTVSARAAVPAASLLRIGNGPEPETLDPHKAEGVSTANILRDLYEGLVIEGPGGTLRPGVAERWDVADGGRLYRFHLRADARWSNGDAVTADDFVAGLRRSADPRTGSNYTQILAPIDNAAAVSRGELPPERLGVEAPDAHTVLIRLHAPTPYFLTLLNHQAMLPIHRPSLARWGAAFARPGHLVSNGAYRLVDWVVQARVTLERNPYYWDAAHTAIDRVQYLPTEDVAAELKRYRADELDITYDLPLTQAPWVRRHYGAELHLAPYLGSYFYGFNLSRPPFRDNLALRQALTMAIDPRLIVDKVMNGLALPAWGWVPPGINGYVPQRLPWADWPLAQRLDAARRLYAEAGYSAAQPLHLELRYNTQNDHKRIATVIAAMWKQRLGVETTLVNEEWKVFLQTRRARVVTQVFRGGWIADFNDAESFLDILRSGSGMNNEGFSDAGVDALLDAVDSREDPAARTAALAAAETRVLQQLPGIPIYFYVSKHLVKPWVRGWQDEVLDHHFSKDLRIERLPPPDAEDRGQP